MNSANAKAWGTLCAYYSPTESERPESQNPVKGSPHVTHCTARLFCLTNTPAAFATCWASPSASGARAYPPLTPPGRRCGHSPPFPGEELRPRHLNAWCGAPPASLPLSDPPWCPGPPLRLAFMLLAIPRPHTATTWQDSDPVCLNRAHTLIIVPFQAVAQVLTRHRHQSSRHAGRSRLGLLRKPCMYLRTPPTNARTRTPASERKRTPP